MKKYLVSTFTLAAAALLVTSCNDEMDNGLKTGEEGTVTFTAQLPAEIGTRAFADGQTAKHLKYAVYEAGETLGNPLPIFENGATYAEATMENLKKSVTLKLTTGKTYDVIFWADATTDSPYTFDPVSKNVTVDYAKVNNNSDNCDAFFRKYEITVSGNQAVDVELYRPFAQVNIGTDDYEAAKASGLEVAETMVKAKAFGTLNLATGAVSDEAEREFKLKSIPTDADGAFPVTGYKYLSMNYLLVGADKTTVDVTLNYGGPQERTFTSVPVQRNFRTNIYGSLLTNTTDFNVVIEPAFTDPANNLGALYTASQIGGAVTLSDNVTFDRTIAVQPSVSMTVNLNGKTVNNTTDLWGNPSVPDSWSLFSVRGADGKLTLSGDGEVIAKANDCFAVDVQDGGHLVIEGGHYNGNIHAVYVEEGTAEIKGGTFEVQQKYPDAAKADEFVLNCYDTNRADGTAKIIVTGGTFIGFNPGNCKAEGEGTNFLAPGYASIADGTTTDGRTIWKVVPAVEATTEAELEGSFKSGSVTAISSNIMTSSITVCRTKSNLVMKNGSVLKLEPTETGSLYTLSARGASNGNLTISGNGTVTAPILINPNPKTSQAAAIEVGVNASSGTVNIYDNVTFEGNSGAAGSYAIRLVNGTANIYGGHFKTAGGLNGNSECIYLESIKPWKGAWKQCNLNIYGGVFETSGDATYLINCQDDPYKDGKCSVKIMGGTFVGFNPADNSAEGEHTNFVADGYKSVETTYNGKQAWKVVKK